LIDLLEGTIRQYNKKDRDFETTGGGYADGRE